MRDNAKAYYVQKTPDEYNNEADTSALTKKNEIVSREFSYI